MGETKIENPINTTRIHSTVTPQTVYVYRAGVEVARIELQPMDELRIETQEKWQRCTVCNGTGTVAYAEGQYCGCPTGRDLARIAARVRNEPATIPHVSSIKFPEFGDGAGE